MKLKVIEYVNAMADGGAETLVKDYGYLLDKDRFDVSIMCIYRLTSSANSKRVQENGTDMMYVFSSHNAVNRIMRKLFGRWYIPYAIKRAIKEKRRMSFTST